MATIVPQLVDNGNPTISGLRHRHKIVSNDPMPGTEFPYEAIGERLRRIRVAFSKDTQKDWAGRQGFSLTQYNNWELGARRIPVDHAEFLCDKFGLTLDFIYRGREDGLSENARKSL